MIYSGHSAENKIFKIAKLNESINELKNEFIDKRSQLIQLKMSYSSPSQTFSSILLFCSLRSSLKSFIAVLTFEPALVFSKTVKEDGTLNNESLELQNSQSLFFSDIE